ncbi:hypothetical protein HMPREF9163_00224 [Selenomonas sp. oral taxon 138 str. F0429]|nr:hypothetical protein HMPREF9163_00224 [Selenomonas sp. oral taxon 138 str. F0429]
MRKASTPFISRSERLFLWIEDKKENARFLEKKRHFCYNC